MLEIYIEKIYDLLIPAAEYNIKTRAELQMQLGDPNDLTNKSSNSRPKPNTHLDDVTGLMNLPVA